MPKKYNVGIYEDDIMLGWITFGDVVKSFDTKEEAKKWIKEAHEARPFKYRDSYEYYLMEN